MWKSGELEHCLSLCLQPMDNKGNKDFEKYMNNMDNIGNNKKKE